MKATSLVLAGAMSAALLACGGNGKRAASPSGDGLPPLIDRALLFGDAEISSPELSPDGARIAFIKPHDGVRNVWVKGIDEPFDAARPVTADDRPVPGYFWSRDGRYILYVQDKGGNEDFHVYAVDPAAAPGPDGVPPARNLTPIDGVRAMIHSVPRSQPGVLIVGLNDRDPAYHDVYRIDIATGERTKLIENTDRVGAYVFDEEGTPRMAVKQTDSGGTELLVVEGETLRPIYEASFEESAFPVKIHPDGKRAYVITNKGADVDLSRLVLLDLGSAATEVIESDPEKQVDMGGAIFHPRTDELLATVYVGDRQRVYVRDQQWGRAFERLKAALPDGELSIVSTTDDLSTWLVSLSSDVDPGTVYVYRAASGEVEQLYQSRPALPREHLATMQPVRYQARDGLEIPAYLTVPRGVEAKNLPTVVFPHGGPWARDYWGYDAFAQFLANRGYAVLQPNFRASTGYGKKFLNAGNRQWGTGAMQHDLTDGARWLVEQGIADADKMCIMGGSYGGYAVLAAATFTPELFQCGVAIVAPSNIVTLLESIPPYWRPFAKAMYERVGDPEVAADRADLEARSPLFFADRIRMPLLVVHGANDPRVKQSEADSIVAAMHERDLAVAYLVAPDEGHGFQAPENRLAMAVAVEQFLGEHLGGRVQKEVPGPIAERLAAITVDPAKVEAPSDDERARAEAAMTAALPEADGAALAPATMRYQAVLAVGGQRIEMDMSRTVTADKRDGKPVWRIVDRAQAPMGEMVDRFDVDRETLRPVARELEGMAAGTLTYAPDAIRGKLGAPGGPARDLEIALQAPVLGDGPGLVAAIAGLPLAEGYRAILRELELTTGKVEARELVVTGAGSVDVGGKSVAVWNVELRPLTDGATKATLRVQRDAPHWVVSAEYALPASMGGGTMTTALVAAP